MTPEELRKMSADAVTGGLPGGLRSAARGLRIAADTIERLERENAGAERLLEECAATFEYEFGDNCDSALQVRKYLARNKSTAAEPPAAVSWDSTSTSC